MFRNILYILLYGWDHELWILYSNVSEHSVYSFIWVRPRTLNFICQCIGTPCIFFYMGETTNFEFYIPMFRNTLYIPPWYLVWTRIILFFFTRPIKMEQTGCSETSAHKIQTPGNRPRGNNKTRIVLLSTRNVLTVSPVSATPYSSKPLGCCKLDAVWGFADGKVMCYALLHSLTSCSVEMGRTVYS
jgi:hypothetical protein